MPPEDTPEMTRTNVAVLEANRPFFYAVNGVNRVNEVCREANAFNPVPENSSEDLNSTVTLRLI